MLDISILDSIDQVYTSKHGPLIKHVFLAGIGGSHLGAQAVYDAVSSLPYQPDPVNFYPITAVDAASLAQLVQQFEKLLRSGEHLMLIVVSKSGATLETAAHASLLYTLVKQHRPTDYRDYIIVVTDHGSVLWQQAELEALTCVPIPREVGGRYSIFSAAGLLVLKFLHIDSVQLVAGAQSVKPEDAHASADQLYQAYQDGYLVYDIFTFMPRYVSLALWYRQLVGESLGKEGKGFLPTVSTAQDLHSVIQQYFGGKQITFTSFLVPAQQNSTSIPQSLFAHAAKLYEPITFAHLQDSIIQGVLAAYKNAHKPFLVHSLKPGSLFDMGKFMQLKMYETIALGKLMGVNPFDQPEVELYKQQTRKILQEIR